jgi:small conductance mechanosensitive channel
MEFTLYDLFSSIINQANLESVLWFLQKLAIACIIIALTWLTTKIVVGLVSKTLGFVNTKVAHQVNRVTSIFIWLVGITQALGQLGLDPILLFMIIGVIGLAAIIAFKDQLQNAVAFNLIKTYELFKIGDWIELNEYFGRVIDLTWVNTVLLTRENERLYIPNSRIIQGNLVNRTVQGGIRMSVPLTLDRSISLTDVERILLEVSDELKEELTPSFIPEVRVISLDETSVKVELLLRISNPAMDSLIASNVLKKTQKKIRRC